MAGKQGSKVYIYFIWSINQFSDNVWSYGRSLVFLAGFSISELSYLYAEIQTTMISEMVVFFGLVFILNISMMNDITFFDRIRWSWEKSRINQFSGLMIGIVSALIIGPLGGFFVWFILGILMGGVSREEIIETTKPEQHVQRSISSLAIIAILCSLIIGIIFTAWMTAITPILIIILVPIVLFGFLIFVSLVQHFTLRSILVLKNSLPRNIVPYLEHCVNLIFLRQIGGSYIFVHRLLMEHFAEMEV